MYNKTKARIRLALLKQKLRKENKVVKIEDSFENKPYVLIVDQIIPEFTKDSGSRRLTEIIKLLLKNNFGVILMADKKEYRYTSQYISFFKEMGVIVYEPFLDESGALVTKNLFLKKVLLYVDFTWLHRPEIFSKYEPLIRKEKPSAKIFFDMVDFHYLRFMREFELTGDKSVQKKADKYLKMELDSCEKADKIIVISEQDKKSLSDFYKKGDSKISVISNIHQKIDREFPGFKERKDILFIGGFFHSPNVDCVFYLHNEIMPLVWKVLPEVCVQIVGSNPTEELLALNSEKFKVVGYVENIDPYFLNSRLFVAPLRYGAGIKGKIGQSLEYGLPLVTTAIGAEGFDFGTSKDKMVGEKSEDLAKKIIDLYQNETLWNEIKQETAKIIAPFSIEASEPTIMKLLR